MIAKQLEGGLNFDGCQSSRSLKPETYSILAGKLSTGLHTERVKPSLKDNTTYYYAILASLCILSIFISLIAGGIAYALTPNPSGGLTLIIVTCITTQALTLLITIPGTSLLGFLAFKRGLDPDVVIYPLSSNVADISATTSFLIALAMGYMPRLYGRPLLYGIGTTFLLFTLGLTYFVRREKNLRRVLKSTLITVGLVTLISTVTGLGLVQIGEYLTTTPGVLIIYPALIDTLGDAAAIFGSVSTTKLVLGETNPELRAISEQKDVLLQIFFATLIFSNSPLK